MKAQQAKRVGVRAAQNGGVVTFPKDSPASPGRSGAQTSRRKWFNVENLLLGEQSMKGQAAIPRAPTWS